MTPWMEPISDASAWSGEDLQRDQSWKLSLTSEQTDDLAKALKQVKERGLQFAEILREDFPLPSLRETLQKILDELRSGRGFVVLSGFPSP